jgi:hypothetical protein
MSKSIKKFLSLLVAVSLLATPVFAPVANGIGLSPRRAKEGIVVVGIPASSELRNAIGQKFNDKFGISIELLAARGPENVTRIITEHNSGVRYYDILVAGGATPLSMVAAGAADDLMPYLILPEVKDPKNWWGGHVWEDNVTVRHIYALSCYTNETLWYNASQADVTRSDRSTIAQFQVERTHRSARSAQSWIGAEHLVVHVESQRGISRKLAQQDLLSIRICVSWLTVWPRASLPLRWV